MLFRRFMLLTSVIALIAIAFINIVQATTASHHDFLVGDRLRQWEQYEKQKTCPRTDILCQGKIFELNKV